MIPIRDLNPGLRRPLMTLLLLVGVSLVYFFVQPASPGDELAFLYRWAAVSCEISGNEAISVQEVRAFECLPGAGIPIYPEKSIPLSVIVSIFLHGGLAHLLGNMWSLWLFGNNVEDAYGRIGFLFLYLTSGVVATFGFVVARPESTVPLLGASGAIAGVMGAYFVLFPAARVLSFIPPLFFLPLRVSAAFFLVIWLVGQFLLVGSQAGIAWEAHVAGFIYGAVVTWVLRRGLVGRLADLREAQAMELG